jgi:hypothetical protein
MGMSAPSMMPGSSTQACSALTSEVCCARTCARRQGELGPAAASRSPATGSLSPMLVETAVVRLLAMYLRRLWWWKASLAGSVCFKVERLRATDARTVRGALHPDAARRPALLLDTRLAPHHHLIVAPPRAPHCQASAPLPLPPSHHSAAGGSAALAVPLSSCGRRPSTAQHASRSAGRAAAPRHEARAAAGPVARAAAAVHQLCRAAAGECKE